jgi:hypothetical protein
MVVVGTTPLFSIATVNPDIALVPLRRNRFGEAAVIGEEGRTGVRVTV